MQAIIDPGYIRGTVSPPASKSMMQRACAGALLHRGKTVIHNPGHSKDDQAALSIIQQLGATVTNKTKSIEIVSHGIAPITDTIDCGESGLSARLFLPIAALHHETIKVTGHGSLLKRPMLFFLHILPELGAQVSGSENYLPIHVKGPLQPANIKIDGSVSSQYLSGLLFAYAYRQHAAPLEITVDSLTSKPYADLTIDVLQKFGAEIIHEHYQKFTIVKPINSDGTVTIEIENDWSSAATLLVAGALAGVITVKNMNTQSLQADREILTVLQQAGADITCDENDFEIRRTGHLHPFTIDITHCPDLAPVLAILAAQCSGTSHIKGIQRLVYKESNRIESISAMLRQLGVSFEVTENTLSITGGHQFESCTIDAHNDHRIVMAAAVAGLNAKGPVTINGAEAVAKSYPDFFSHLPSLGAKCKIINE